MDMMRTVLEKLYRYVPEWFFAVASKLLWTCLSWRIPIVSDLAFGWLSFAKAAEGETGFNGDRVFQELLLNIVRSCAISSFVETGTHCGASTYFLVKAEPRLPIYTCELNKGFYEFSKRRLGKFKKVRIGNESSEKFLRRLTQTENLGARPLFYLDAHWYDYWPLPDEIEIITSGLEKSVIVIHDFEVPGRADFKFACYGRPCNLELIQPKLRAAARYHMLFPSYRVQDVFPEDRANPLVGYVVIFHNQPDAFRNLEAHAREFLDDNFTRWEGGWPSESKTEHSKDFD
jgi:hypothetical protein